MANVNADETIKEQTILTSNKLTNKQHSIIRATMILHDHSRSTRLVTEDSLLRLPGCPMPLHAQR